MNRLEKRVERLEGGIDPEEVIIWGQYPLGCSEQRFREIAEGVARDRGYQLPFKIDARCTNLPGGEEDITLVFIGTGAEFGALLDQIRREGRRITDREPRRSGMRL